MVTAQLAAGHGRPVPAIHSRLIGRGEEVERLLDELRRPDVAIVTITGPGGAGKTRLAIEVAQRLNADYVEEPTFVDLSVVASPEAVAGAVTRAFGLVEVHEGLVEHLVRSLRGSTRLCLIDNFEHLLPAASIVAELAAGCPDLRFLITSRAPLRVRGEVEFKLQPLALPAFEAQSSAITPRNLEDISSSPSVALFCERASAGGRPFTLDQDTAPVVAQICRRLDGLPLAIELAATRSKVLSPPELLARLDSRLKLLTGGPRDAPERQRALRDTIAWSYDLLSPEEQRLFRCMGLLRGGSTLAGIESMSGSGDRTLDIVHELVDKSLLVEQAGLAGPRFTMLDTIREFAIDQLRARGELDEQYQRLAQYIIGLAMEAEPHMMYGGDRRTWLHRLADEHQNTLNLLQWCVDNDRGDLALPIVGTWLWGRARLLEGRRWPRLILSLPSSQAQSISRCRALFTATCVAADANDLASMRVLSEENVAISRALGDPRCLAFALSLYAGTDPAHTAGDLDAIYTEALDASRAADDPWLTAKLYMNHSVASLRLGDAARAYELGQEALTRFEELGDEYMHAFTEVHLSLALLQLGRSQEARSHLERCEPVLEDLGDVYCEVVALVGLAIAASQLGQPGEACVSFARALRIGRDVGDSGHLPIVLEGLAMFAASAGDKKGAAQLLEDATELRRRGMAPYVGWVGSWGEAASLQAAATAPPSPGPNHREATAMIGHAIAVVDGLITSQQDHRAVRSEFASLSAREAEVLRCLARGLSNREIADELVLSVRTVEKHVANVYAKIGARGRVDAAAFAFRSGIL